DNICTPLLIENETKFKELAKQNKIRLNWERVKFLNQNEHSKNFAGILYKLRKNKGLTLSKANKLIKDKNYFACITLFEGIADGIVTGLISPTANAIRPALQIIKTKEKFHKVSGVFFIQLGNRTLMFADCAINIDPDAKTLSEIICDSNETAKKFGLKPKIAVLSFSTKGSAKHPNIEKIKKGIKLAKIKNSKLIIDGELQVDAALVPEVATIKNPKSSIKGDANLLIFPNLESGNIAYKLTERLAGAKAVGPILQGLKKPVNDLSRGCGWIDIVNLTAFTVCESADSKYKFN
ncbi:phosphate acetyltransferase, partial [Candidatus Peregrinibacteria bacterium]|nr:phosphate acetyltransferase [Candidatus Peregrinibacteria bacterium]